MIRNVWCVLLLAIPLQAQFKLGVERLDGNALRSLGVCKRDACPVGLVTNQTGIDQAGVRNVHILRQKGVHVSHLFAPEHGIDGSLGSSVHVADGIDQQTGIPVVSLYQQRSGKKVGESVLGDIDAFIFDMQDSGMRHYTYISTLFHVMEMGAQHNKPVIVLDRPNPLGVRMEGPLVEPKFISFMSIAPIPVRHGMTMGELARYFNEHVLKDPAQLHVIAMEGYRRDAAVSVTDHAPISSGLRTMQSCYGYSFLGLLGEVSPFDVGLRSDVRYHAIMLPVSRGVSNEQWSQLQSILRARGVTSHFHEQLSPRTNQPCHGLRLEIEDINRVNSFAALLDTLHFFHTIGVPIRFSKSFSTAMGTAKVRAIFEGTNPEVTRVSLAQDVQKDLAQFFQTARSLFLYEPYPVVASTQDVL